MANYLEAKREIESFANLKKGWHYGEGGPIEPSRIAIMCEVLLAAHFLGFDDFEVFPGVEGEVLLEITSEPYSVDITINSDSTFTFAIDCGRENHTYAKNLSFFDVQDRLEQFASPVCRILELYMPATLTGKESPKTWLSGIHATAQGSPVWTVNVPQTLLGTIVVTSGGSITHLQGTQ